MNATQRALRDAEAAALDRRERLLDALIAVSAAATLALLALAAVLLFTPAEGLVA